MLVYFFFFISIFMMKREFSFDGYKMMLTALSELVHSPVTLSTFSFVLLYVWLIIVLFQRIVF